MPKRSLQGQIIKNCKRTVPQFQIWSSNIEYIVYKCSKQEIEWDHQKQPFQVQKGLSLTQKSNVTKEPEKFGKVPMLRYSLYWTRHLGRTNDSAK